MNWQYFEIGKHQHAFNLNDQHEKLVQKLKTKSDKMYKDSRRKIYIMLRDETKNTALMKTKIFTFQTK